MFQRIALAATILATPAAALAQTEAKAEFALPELPYSVDALEPAISAATMELHHGKHHQAYVDNLNKALAEEGAPTGKSIEELVAAAGTYTPAIRNNAGGHWNHTFFWESMAPADQRGEMSEELSQAITEEFGSVEEFQAAFEKAGAARFGSGWVWLIVNGDNQLEITSTPNQDNPLMDVAETSGTPLLGNDVWEHAYYLTYQNRRPEYLAAWWDVVNWTKVSERFDATQTQ
ncbi:superoxide dismutase [Paracoccus laeviglucosivorans]|uniref:Superoxide dismutase n=1 Tax=Paracoccus laeviglucosivorans TaxID=1197861 RepID=A0A521BD38_9RHOB|nr:superoxide dismutase [Paracoccus laeviglucosivorans]SMO45018.1 superoxide dismutase, Fe-Mn family [Paracoccus laeviglucosivorans]